MNDIISEHCRKMTQSVPQDVKLYSIYFDVFEMIMMFFLCLHQLCHCVAEIQGQLMEVGPVLCEVLPGWWRSIFAIEGRNQRREMSATEIVLTAGYLTA